MATSGSGRRHRRRAGRAGGGVHAGGPRLRRRPLREQPLARRQGGGPRRGRLPLRHGADHPDHPAVLRRIFAEAGRRLDDYLDLVRLDPQWRCFFDDGRALDLVADVEAMARRSTPSPRGRASGYRDFQALSDRLHGISDRHFFWKSIGGIGDMIDLKAGFSPKILGDVLACGWAARSPARCGSSCRTPASRRCSTTSPSTSARRPTARRRCSAASRTCRPAKASGIRWAARGPCPRRW